jgi:aminopeptidase N
MRQRLLFLVMFLLPLAAWAEEPPKPPPPPPLDHTTRDFHQHHIDLAVRPDMAAGTVEGRVRLAFESTVARLETLRLHCADTEVRSVVCAGGNPATHEVKEGILSIRLPAPLGEGEPFEVTIEYLARPTRGLYFHRPTEADPSTPWLLYSQGQGNDNRRWIPCYDEPDDRCTWEVRARVEDRFRTVSNGERVGTEAHGDGTRTDHWRFDTANPTYLISLIVGTFETITERIGEVLLEYHGPPGRPEELRTALGETPDMLAFFSDYAGPYPWKRYAQTFVWDFVYGGMENTTATTLNMRALHTRAVRPNYSSAPLVSHELAHMWFGDLLTCRTWDHIWLNEGFATYFTDLWYEHAEGDESFRLRRREQNGRYLADTPHPEDLGLTKAPRGDLPLELHGGKQYNRGAAILHMLRREIGDEAFRDAVRRWVATFRDRCVISEDLRRVVEEAAGRDLRWFFDQWVYGAGYPVLEVSYDRPAGRLRVRQAQDRKGGQGLFRVTVPVRVGATGEVVPVRIYREEHEFAVPRGEFVRFGVGGDLLIVTRQEQSPEEWRAQLASDPDFTGRMDAAEALERFGPSEAASLARALGEDRSFAVRRAVAEILARLDGPEVLPALLSAASDPDSRVREAVMSALGKRTRAEAGAAVTRAAIEDPHPYVRAEAARSVGRLKAERGFETLQALLAVDSHEDIVRRGAVEGLRHLADPRGADLAARYLDYEWGKGGTHGLRQVSLDCLTALAPDRRTTHATLVSLLDDPYHNMRAWAAEACGRFVVKSAVPRLEVMSEKDWHEGSKSAAKAALERLK